ncbi:MAG: late competence development ComFB family protein [Glaciecola sp.]
MKFDADIHNVYEHLVMEELNNFNSEDYASDYIADLICLILNQLPPRYIRHDVDLAFYQTTSEKHHMMLQVKTAVHKAVKFLEEHKNQAIS